MYSCCEGIEASEVGGHQEASQWLVKVDEAGVGLDLVFLTPGHFCWTWSCRG